MLTFLAHALIVLAAWTVTIKYLFPIAFALAEGVPLATYVYWDLWPVAHVWMAWALLVRPHPRYTFALAVGMSVVEIVIVVTKFALFFADGPEWTIWQTNWFINKIFVLACFGLLLPAAIAARRAGAFAEPAARGGHPPRSAARLATGDETVGRAPGESSGR